MPSLQRLSTKGRMSEKIGTTTLQSAIAPVNPQFHDEFVALVALYYSGDISEEEWALLQIHMPIAIRAMRNSCRISRSRRK